MKYIIALTITCILFNACEDPSNIKISTTNQELIAVEGVITNESINHLIKISYPYKIQNGEALPVTGALVEIMDGDNNTYQLMETPIGSGEYYTPVLVATTGKIYTLSIQYEGKIFSAQDSAVPVESLQELQYKKIDNRYELILNNSGEQPNYIDHSIEWQNTSACVAGEECAGRIVFYDLKNIDVNDIYKPAKDEFTFPAQAKIIRRKYSTSAAYKAFLRGMLSETEWRGGFFDVQRADVPTNLSEGAVGFFGISTMVSDTTIITELP